MTTGRMRRLPVVGRFAMALVAAIVATPVGLAVAADDKPPAGVSAPFQPARPYWPELTMPQREALAPLVSDWEHLDSQTKKKWVEIANRYPRMKPEEQSHAQERMREWATLTPEQRRVARDTFARIRALPPEQRADVLRKYQELPPEKREALTHQGTRSKGLIVPKASLPTPAVTLVRRAQIREGARVRNPAIAAQKSASPVAAPLPRPAAPRPTQAGSGGNDAAAATSPPAAAVVAPATAAPAGAAAR